jgi:hypothetical protein
MGCPEGIESDLDKTTRSQEQRRTRFEQLLVRALGDDEEELRKLTALQPLDIPRPDPWPPPGGGSEDPRFTRTISAKEVSVREIIQRELEEETLAHLGRLVRLPHSHQLRYAPYDTVPTATGLVDGDTTHGGHPATEQVAYGEPKDGLLGIFTKIQDDSSQTDSTGFFDVTVRAVLSRGSLILTPFLTYDVYHYLQSAGFGDCHSDGLIGMVLTSTAQDGSDPIEEDRQELSVWDAHCSGFNHTGTSDLNQPADEHGMVDAMLRLSTSIQQGRIYKARPYIRSRADADGRHTFYASQALVSYHATLHWLEIDESW